MDSSADVRDQPREGSSSPPPRVSLEEEQTVVDETIRDGVAGPSPSADRDVEKASRPNLKSNPNPNPDTSDLRTYSEEKALTVVKFDGEDDPYSPLNMSPARKWVIVFVISAASTCVTCCSSVVASTYAGVEESFNVSREVAILGLSTFVAGLGLGPLFLGPLSEFYGRNPIYQISYLFFIAFNFPVAFAPNVTSYLFGRFLSGVSGSAFLSVAGGSVSDIFEAHKVGTPMAVYTASPFLGPVLGPVIGDFINQNADWRVTWYVQIGWAAAQYLALLLLVPETYPPMRLKSKAKELRKRTGDPNIKAPVELDERSIPKVVALSCVRPFEILFFEPMAFLLCAWTALLLAILYMFFSAFPIVFGAHGFNQQETGLSFLGLGTGVIIGTGTYKFWGNIYAREAKKLGRKPPPEIHLRKGMVGGVLVPASLFWFAFTTYPSVHWIVPIIATVPFMTGVILVFQAVFTFLVDAYRPYAASAMAANSFFRSCLAAAFPLFSVQMYNKLGSDWATALCAFLTLALAPLPFIFYRYGAHLRRRSRFSDTS